METLSLLGIHTDNEQVVLVDREGERYLLPINEELQSIVRRHRRKAVAALAEKPTGSLRPREIQTMIRSGLSAAEVATAAGVDIAHVQRYEDPVLSERAWAARQARETPINANKNAPNLGDLVIDRLATRGVSPTLLNWDATRQPGENWMIHLEFVQDAKSLEANWDFDPDNRILTALDEQARWLTETATPSGSDTLLSRSTLFRPEVPTGNSEASQDTKPEPQPVTKAETNTLLDEINAARGTRLQMVDDDAEDDVAAMEAAIASNFSEEDTASEPAVRRSILGADTPAESDAQVFELSPAAPQETDAATLPGMEDVGQAENPPSDTSPAETAKRSRRGRAPMPSWDEILFGTKNN